MDARLIRPALLAVTLIVSMGARFQGQNFIVETADPQMAARISQAAEQYPPRPGDIVAGQVAAKLGPALHDEGAGRRPTSARAGPQLLSLTKAKCLAGG